MKTKTEVKKTVVKTKTKKGKTNHKDNLSKRVRERERVKNKLRTKEREKGVLVFTLYKILGASSMRERERVSCPKLLSQSQWLGLWWNRQVSWPRVIYLRWSILIVSFLFIFFCFILLYI